MTSQPYDPLNFDTWPDEQVAELRALWDGLEDGDLGPLAAYLRAGKYIPDMVGEQIADAIEKHPLAPFHIVTKRRARGTLSGSEMAALHKKRMRIGVYAEKECLLGGYESAMAATTARFKVSRKTANDARNYVLKMIAQPDNATTWESALDEWYSPNA